MVIKTLIVHFNLFCIFLYQHQYQICALIRWYHKWVADQLQSITQVIFHLLNLIGVASLFY